MANPGLGNRFVSVNLNKSYGQPSNKTSQSSFANRGWSGGHGGGGGMVVLSRPRSSQKPGAKLSVPPPLNLPSLRKEHERFDLSVAGTGQGTGGLSGGQRPTSSGPGWAKPGNASLLEKNNGIYRGGNGSSFSGGNFDGVSKGSSAYVPSMRTSITNDPVPNQGNALNKGIYSLDKSMILRGEDFPSLRAALPGPSVSIQKQDNSNKHVISEESNNIHSSTISHIKTELKTVHVVKVLNESGAENDFFGGHGLKEQLPKSDYFPGPFSSVLLNPRSDWADDERDTSHGLTSHGRDTRFTKNEDYWDEERGISRGGVMSQKPIPNMFNKLVDEVDESRKFLSTESAKMGKYTTDLRASSWEGKSWRTSHFPQDISTDGSGARSSISYDGRGKVGGRWQDGYGRREASYAGGVQHEPYGEKEQYGRYGGHVKPLSSTASSIPLHVKSPLSKNVVDDVKDGKNPLSPGRPGVAKKKKDQVRQDDFHDPVRESFEAELERVQKMQEEERQRLIEEQERALELARREEEETLRLAREHEERERKLEQDAREAAWRAEQERLEALRRADEQRVAREEEKRMILMEEERRKEAAKQKLLELEARIAKRQAEEPKSNGVHFVSVGSTLNGKNPSKASEMEDWEDGEKIVERITTSSSSDSSIINRSFQSVATTRFSRDGSTALDREKHVNLWKKDPFINQGQGNYSHIHGRAFLRKEVNGGRLSNGYNGNTEKELERYEETFSSTSLYPDHSLSADVEDPALSRSRYSIRQPRVLPPPSLAQPNRVSNLQHSAEDMREKNETVQLNHGDPQVISEVVVSDGRITPMSESQSSISVSSLPDSPENISDESGDSPRVSPSTDIPLAENAPAVEERDKFQEQEEYDEDAVGYQEEDDVHEAEDLTQDLREMCLEKESPEVENTVLGFNEGVEVSMPCDKCDDISRSDAVFLTPVVSTEELELLATVKDEVPERETPDVSSIPDRADLPANLQFGLFSGPPFPAIQIGSIQLPLHLHHPLGPSTAQIHATPFPFFQFGQVRYTPTTTQGVLSLCPQPVSHVPPPEPANDALQPAMIESESVMDPIPKTNKGTIGNNKGRGLVSRPPPGALSAFNSKLPGRRGSRYDPRRVRPQHPAAITTERFVPFRKFPRWRTMPRTEFRIRANFNKQSAGLISSTPCVAGTKREYEKGRPVNTEYGMGNSVNVLQRQGFSRNESSTGKILNKENKREPRVRTASSATDIGVKSLKRNLHYQDYIEAPLQRGIVRIFEQHGIEVPSDEDDFIEVRSKRQMLNDRRMQREKENMAKSKPPKVTQKPCPSRKGVMQTGSSRDGHSLERERENINGDDVVATQEQCIVASSSFDEIVLTHTPCSISEPCPDMDIQLENTKSLQQSALGEGNEPEKNEVINNVQSYQQVMPLTQSQLDEAMKAEKFNSGSECNVPSSSSSIFVKDSMFSSSSPVSSLLAGEKIQFGAVTSPTVLPPGSRAVTNGTDLDGSATLEDHDAEAAASAVAVAAISSDETIGSGLGTSVAVDNTVTLPADLSIETLPITPWPSALTHPPCSAQLIPHLSGAQPRMPFYDIRPVLGPVLAFGPQEDAARTHNPLGSGLLGPWQHHPRAETYGHFGGPPGGFPAPPHMVLYNHFAAPFGQVGMSFLGTAYIPSGKPNEWKHNSDGDIVPGEDRPPNPSGRIQNIAPGPSLLPMFGPTPFQGSSDGPSQAHWAHMSTSPPVISIIPTTQQQLPPAENSPQPETGPASMNPGLAQLSADLVDPSGSDISAAHGQRSGINAPQSSSLRTNTSGNSTFKGVPRNYGHSDFGYRRGGGGYIQKATNSGHEWGRGRIGFAGRNQSGGAEKAFPPARMKQVYVVKQTICSESGVA